MSASSRAGARTWPWRVLFLVFALSDVVGLLASGTASASITSTSSPAALASSVVADPPSLISAGFVAVPNGGSPTAIATTFGTKILPWAGPAMSVLSNGDAVLAETDHTQSTGPANGPSYADNSPDVLVGEAHDVTVLELKVQAPAYANCLGVNLDYLTSDIPDKSGETGKELIEQYLDGAIAELDPTSQWKLSEFPSNSAVYIDTGDQADFAVTAQDAMLDGDLAASPDYEETTSQYISLAGGTPYAEATGWLAAFTPVTPGVHTVDLSIFDRADQQLDSTVLLNGLSFFHTAPQNSPLGQSCSRGLQPLPARDTTAPLVTLEAPAEGGTTSSVTPSLSGSIGTDYEDLPEVTVKIYAGTQASGTPIQTLNAAYADATWSATPTEALVPGIYTAQAQQSDLSGNVGLSAPHTFGAGTPANISPPTITGTAQEGQKLMASNGSWSNTPTGFANQWLRCDSLGEACMPIAGADLPTYTLVAADVESTIRLQQTASNAGGSSTPAVSAQTPLVVGSGPAPTVAKLSPNKGPAAGGTIVTITGTGFTGATAVRFGSTAARNVSVKSATTITAESPPEVAKTVDVTIMQGGRTSAIRSTDRFKYGPPTVSSVSPSTGPTEGDNTVTVSGSGLGVGQEATLFKFGTTEATVVDCTSISTCTVLVPPHAAGTVDVRATVNGQTSKKAAADEYTYG